MLAAAIGLAAGPAMAAGGPDGEWLVQDGRAKVRVAPCAAGSAELCGRIVWVTAAPDALTHDEHNPDPALRTRPILGLQMLWGFRPAGPNRWTGGKIYDPKAGKTYDSKFTVEGDRMNLSGCIMMFCKTQVWKRTG
jgi:uncharacterized protein (DUF2147 family)